MQTKIQGTTMPVLDVQLEPNESVFSESGELSWMTASIQMTTHTQMGGNTARTALPAWFPLPPRCRGTSCRSRLGQARSTWSTATASSAPPRK